MNKKGVAVWISYVLLIAMVVVIGFFILQWSRSITQDTVDDIVVRGDALTTCQASGIDIKNLCQNTQTLNMDVTNTNDIEVQGLWASMFDIENLPQSGSRNISISPQKTKAIKILKQGILTKAEISPIVEKNDKKIKCLSRKLTFNSIPICD